MKKPVPVLLLLIIVLILPSGLPAQSPPFDLDTYHQFLEDHKNLTTGELLDLYPVELFWDDADVSWGSVLYHDSMEIKLNLTSHEKFLLEKHGFMVTERLRRNSFLEQYLDIWQSDLPVFISTDAILHAFHYYYVEMLQKIEKGALQQLVTGLLREMHLHLPELAAEYTGGADMDQMLSDVDVYVTVPLKLLGENIDPHYAENEAVIDEILALIEAGQFATYPFFSDNCKEIDFSQFTPRGHYADDEDLSRYFQAMMWLGRIEIYLLRPESFPFLCPQQTDADIQRQIIDAALILELMDLAEVNDLWTEVENILTFLVGAQDNATPADLRGVINSMGLTSTAQLLDTTRVSAFQDSLRSQSIGFQSITSQVLAHDPFSTEEVQPAAAFMLFGQRFVIDSYITGNVVYDKISYNNELICRLLPSTLDVLFALGNDPAAQLLVPELDQYHYASNLAALRYLVDSYGDSFWNSSVHTLWLSAIRALNPPQDREALPNFMQTGPWWQQKMNTQLSSWTELRHDHLLYAKQSYTIGFVCSYPFGYVEPVPAAFRRLEHLAVQAQEKFSALPFSDETLKTELLDYFTFLQTTTDQLATIAEKELTGTPLEDEEQAFLQGILFQSGQYGELDGWYLNLLYGPDFAPIPLVIGDPDFPVSDYLAADYHTAPTTCAGALVGWVAHAGTGPVDLAVVAAPAADGGHIAFAGPVMSYYEYTTTNFQRLTDQEWEQGYLQLAGRPDWVNVYLADEAGESKGEGGLIWTGTEDPLPGTDSPLSATCYPNPFSPPVIIRFTVPYSAAKQPAELTVYDAQGRVVKRLMQTELIPGTYLTQWDGADETGQRRPAGVYFYEVKIGNRKVTGKMIMI